MPPDSHVRTIKTPKRRAMKPTNGVGRDVPIAPLQAVCMTVRRDADIASYPAIRWQL